MGKEIYIGIGIEIFGNGMGIGLQMTGVIIPIVGWTIIGLSTIFGLIFIGRGIRSSRSIPIQTVFHFEFNDWSMTTNDGRIQLGVNYVPSRRVTIENLQLEYNDKPFRRTL